MGSNRRYGDRSAGSDVGAARVRHVWVHLHRDDVPPWPGLVIEWRRGKGGWLARVAYVPTDMMLCEAWVEARFLRPMRPGGAGR